MGIRIFDVDPDAPPPRQGFSEDVVGRFRSGASVAGEATALGEWRVTTADPDVAAAVAGLLGGTPAEWNTEGDEGIEVYTSSAAVEVVLDPGAIRSGMVLWGQKGRPIRSCDGLTQKDGNKTPCVCPNTVAARKKAAKEGHGCEPSIQVFFRLAAAPDLGEFRFLSASWVMARDIGAAEDALEAIGGPARALLTLKEESFVAKSGPRKGETITFTKPVLEVLGPVEVAS